jgi:hypothetical protein
VGGASELEVLEPEPVASASSSDSESEEESESGGASSDAEAEAAEEASAAAEAAAAEEALAGGGSPAEDSLEEMGEAAGSPSASSGMPPGGGSPSQGGSIAVSAMPSGEEGGLDAELMESLQVFDGEMQRTITILASAGEVADIEGDTRETGGSEELDSNLDQTGEGPELVLVNGDPSLLPTANSNRGGGGPLQSGVLVSGDVEGEELTNSEAQEGDVTLMVRNQVPPDVGDGANDDVVARQIREAAMNESDPVLREKLWEEYRNYKKSAG